MKYTPAFVVPVVVAASCVSSVYSLECSSGYGGNVRVIPDSHINDGFCDCPLDGLDEPSTDACSGATIGGWAGVKGTLEKSPTFVCPQQPKKLLPLSRLRDGVCDCCDGADEVGFDKTTTCPDICDVVLKAEREARAKAQADYVTGSEIRKAKLADFDKLVQETMVEIKQKEKELKAKEAIWNASTQVVVNAKDAFVHTRRGVVRQIMPLLEELTQTLTNDEIMLLIQTTCQVAGEMQNSMKERTCVPLRLAGVELGILWQDEVFKNISADLITNGDNERILPELVVRVSQGEKVWSEKQINKENGRRRLDDHYPDDDYHYEDEEEDYEEERRRQPVKEEEKEEEAEEEGEEIAKVKAAVVDSAFSRHRKNFLAQSDILIAKIDELLKDDATEDTEDESSEETENDKDEAKESPFDPIAYNLVRSTLQKRRQAIKRGFQYAVSSNILVNAVNKQENVERVRAYLIHLAVATLMHSQVSAEHVWRMLTAILPEYATSEGESQTCASPLVGICPAQSIQRNGITFPPTIFLSAGEVACARAVDEINAAGCGNESSEEIPTEVPDGYYGYHEILPRGEDDPLHSLFSPLSSMVPSDVIASEKDEDRLKSEKSDLEAQIKTLENKIGGRGEYDPLKAELHALKNSCHVVTEGKYDYEVCIFGSAHQRDKGVTTGGTSLGNWRGMTMDDEIGLRLMKWDKGQKCWNGPERSATVIVSCGAETKVLSAEEPDTCRYVIEMESYIACDEDFYNKYLA